MGMSRGSWWLILGLTRAGPDKEGRCGRHGAQRQHGQGDLCLQRIVPNSLTRETSDCPKDAGHTGRDLVLSVRQCL